MKRPADGALPGQPPAKLAAVSTPALWKAGPGSPQAAPKNSTPLSVGFLSGSQQGAVIPPPFKAAPLGKAVPMIPGKAAAALALSQSLVNGAAPAEIASSPSIPKGINLPPKATQPTHAVLLPGKVPPPVKASLGESLSAGSSTASVPSSDSMTKAKPPINLPPRPPMPSMLPGGRPPLFQADTRPAMLSNQSLGRPPLLAQPDARPPLLIGPPGGQSSLLPPPVGPLGPRPPMFNSPPVPGGPPMHSLRPSLPSPGPASTPGFSKAASAAVMSSDLLRKGEELLRQGAVLQQQNLQADLERKRQEELERKQAEIERLRLEAEEKKRQEEEEEQRIRKEADDIATSMQQELETLLAVADAHVERATVVAARLDHDQLTAEEVIDICSDFEGPATSGTSSCKACFDFMDGKHVKLRGKSEAVNQSCAALMKRIQATKVAMDKATTKVRGREKTAKDTIGAESLQAELDARLSEAESEVEHLRQLQAPVLKLASDAATEAKSGPEAGGGNLDEELVRSATEFEGFVETALKAVASCTRLSEGSLVRLRGPTEATKAAATELARRVVKVKSAVEEISLKVKALKSASTQRIEREARKRAEKIENERQERLFNACDKDGDGKLNAEEIKTFVRAEHGFELPQDKLKVILAVSPTGYAWKQFHLLRPHLNAAWAEEQARRRKDKSEKQSSMIRKNSAETLSALSGVEAEVAKAEDKVKLLGPLLPRASVILDFLADSTEQAEAAIDAARDFMAAAKEQAQQLGGDKQGAFESEAKQLAAMEGKKLTMKLFLLESRLSQAHALAKAARAKVDLQLRKAALLRQAEDLS